MSKITEKDIEGRPDIIWEKDGVSEIFDLYKEMFIPFKEVQAAPDYPVNLNLPLSQTFIREIIGFILEECSEAITEFENLVSEVNQPVVDPIALEKGVRAFNEELADILHFVVKLMVYSNIDASAIKSYYLALAKERQMMPITFPDNTLDTAFSIALFYNTQQGYMRNIPEKIHTPIRGPFAATELKIGNETLSVHKEIMFEVFHYLNKASNTLKNKPWKLTLRDTDIAAFQMHLMEAWLRLFSYYQIVGLDSQSLYGIFWYKNMINRKRILNKE